MSSKRIKAIKKTISEMDGLFWEIDYIGDFDHISNDDIPKKNRLLEAQETFQYLAKKLVILCNTHFESENLLNLMEDFKKEISPFVDDPENKLFESFFDQENAMVLSQFTNTVILYLSGLDKFLSESDNVIKKKVGLEYLENILKNTYIILKELNQIPSKETDIYDGVKLVLNSVFVDYSNIHFSFQKKAKCYDPDIIVPHLNAAIEYKYCSTEKELTKCIEEIRIDVSGYNSHPNYNLFYAVFYIKGNFVAEERAVEIWKDNEFPNNWNPIFVMGT